MKLAELQNNQAVRARWGRAGPESPAWGPWRNAELFIQRVPVPARPSRRKLRPSEVPAGGIAVLALRGHNWAEYSERDFDAKFRLFLTEDYYLEIEGLES